MRDYPVSGNRSAQQVCAVRLDGKYSQNCYCDSCPPPSISLLRLCRLDLRETLRKLTCSCAAPSRRTEDVLRYGGPPRSGTVVGVPELVVERKTRSQLDIAWVLYSCYNGGLG